MPFTHDQLGMYINAVISSGWIFPLVTHLVLKRQGEDSRELFVVAEVWGGAIALGLLSMALLQVVPAVFGFIGGMLGPLFVVGCLALLMEGFMRIRKPTVGLPLIICGLLLLSAMITMAYLSSHPSYPLDP